MDASRTNAEFLSNFAHRHSSFVQGEYSVSINDQPRPATDTALLPRPGQAGKRTFAQSDPLLLGDRRQNA